MQRADLAATGNRRHRTVSSLLDTLAGLTSPWGYLLVFLLAGLEAAAFVGLVIPGETAILGGGFLVYQGTPSSCP